MLSSQAIELAACVQSPGQNHHRCRAKKEQIRQSGLESGHGFGQFQVRLIQVFLFVFGSGLHPFVAGHHSFVQCPGPLASEEGTALKF